MLLEWYSWFIFISFNNSFCRTLSFNKTKLALLQKINKIIYGVNWRISCDPFVEESGFLRFAESNRYMIARFMYRCYLNDIPDSFLYHLTTVSVVHYHLTRQSDGLFIPAFKTNLGKICLTYRGPCIWSKLLKLKKSIWIHRMCLWKL